jgi:dolichyl-phosphate beta-glucosyltransferase
LDDHIRLATNTLARRSQVYLFLFTVAPVPRKPLPDEKKFRTISTDGSIAAPRQLPCWQDNLDGQKHAPGRSIEQADLFMSLVVPAYNEQDRLGGMLEEAVNYLERMYRTLAREHDGDDRSVRQRRANGHATTNAGPESGWEIVIVSDGSTDRTEEMAFTFARDHQLSLHPRGYAGPWTPRTHEGVHIPPGTIRVVTLAQNRGKGGAVTHGMRHVRGRYVVFADADGASKFDHLGKLVRACREIEDSEGRGVVVGSRAHMVGSEAVVKVRRLLYRRTKGMLISWNSAPSYAIS